MCSSDLLQILRIIQEESMKDNTAAVHAQVPVEVASFLLNEKRTEIAKIEVKQRINVLLVPNKALETPNYKLERLKHDDPRLDNIEASYKMAEEIEDPTAVTRRSQEPTNKQTPVIKGVLPDAPAPVVEPKPAAAPKPTKPQAKEVHEPASQGFFGWFKSLFGGSQEAPPAADKKHGDKKDDKREGRGNRGGRGRGRGGERAERGEGDGEIRRAADNAGWPNLLPSPRSTEQSGDQIAPHEVPSGSLRRVEGCRRHRLTGVIRAGSEIEAEPCGGDCCERNCG